LTLVKIKQLISKALQDYILFGTQAFPQIDSQW